MGWQGLQTRVSIYKKGKIINYEKDNMPEDKPVEYSLYTENLSKFLPDNDKIYIWRGYYDDVKSKEKGNKHIDSFTNLSDDTADILRQNIKSDSTRIARLYFSADPDSYEWDETREKFKVNDDNFEYYCVGDTECSREFDGAYIEIDGAERIWLEDYSYSCFYFKFSNEVILYVPSKEDLFPNEYRRPYVYY